MFNPKNFLAAALLFVGGVSAANAQIAEGSAIKLNVPNAFVLKDVAFEAGEYTIERTPNTTDSASLLILRGEGETMVFNTMVSSNRKTANATQLVFDRVGGTNYLTGIIVEGSDAINEIPQTKSQKKATIEGSAVRHYLTFTNTGF